MGYTKEVESNSHEREIRVNIEDELAAANTEELQDLATWNSDTVQQQLKIDSKVLIKGSAINKARALKNFSKYRKHSRSTDPLKRVQSIAKFSSTENLLLSSANDISLLRIGSDFWLCVREVNGFQVDGQPVDYISFEILGEETVNVSVLHQCVNITFPKAKGQMESFESTKNSQKNA